jgi:CDP-diacylglycerol--serine O-phosphatidyltransferase
MALIALVSFLMVSTWRYPSFKDLSLMRPRSPLTIIPLAIAIFLVWQFPRPAFLAMAAAYMLSGIVIRIGGAMRRRLKPPPPEPEHQIG